MNRALVRGGGPGRTGVASVVGTLIFVAVLVLALGAQAYMAGLQAQVGQSSLQAQEAENLRGREALVYENRGGGLAVVNEGPGSTEVVGMYLRFPNGSVYHGSYFTPVNIPEGGGASVQNMVPAGSCLPSGSSTCIARFGTIAGTQSPGYSVGLVTSLGNSFWYAPAAGVVSWTSVTDLPAGCASGQYVEALGTTLTCSQVGWAQLAGFPSGCGAGQYVTAIGTTLACSSVPWSALGGFPTPCPAGEFVSALGPDLTCGSASGGSAMLCTDTSPGGVASLACTSLPSYRYYEIRFDGDYVPTDPLNPTVPFQVIFNGDTTSVYSETYPGTSSPWSNCQKSNSDNGLTLITGASQYMVFTMDVAQWPGSGYIATWSAMSASGFHAGPFCVGGGTYPTASALTSVAIPVPASQGSWGAGSTLTVYGLQG